MENFNYKKFTGEVRYSNMEEKYCCRVTLEKKPTEIFADTVEELEIEFKKIVDNHFMRIEEEKRLKREEEKRKWNEKEQRRLERLQKQKEKQKFDVNERMTSASEEYQEYQEYKRDINDDSRSEYIGDLLKRMKRVRK